jgi:hypothetical protein
VRFNLVPRVMTSKKTRMPPTKLRKKDIKKLMYTTL